MPFTPEDLLEEARAIFANTLVAKGFSQCGREAPPSGWKRPRRAAG